MMTQMAMIRVHEIYLPKCFVICGPNEGPHLQSHMDPTASHKLAYISVFPN